MNPSTRKMHKPTRCIKAKAIQWQMGEGREEVTASAKLVASLSEVPQTQFPLLPYGTASLPWQLRWGCEGCTAHLAPRHVPLNPSLNPQHHSLLYYLAPSPLSFP